LKAIAFDKTGTLTEGRPVVTDIIPLSSMNKESILSISRAIESYSQHPLASAIIQKAKKSEAEEVLATDFQSITGKGAQTIVYDETYFIGNPRLFEEITTISNDISDQIVSLQTEGKTVMILGTANKLLGLIAVADQVRESSLSIIEKLRNLGIKKTVLLTGDNKATGKAIGHKLGLSETYAE